jgi:hypothetical protein
MAAETGCARVEQGTNAATAQSASAAPIFWLSFIDTFGLRQPYLFSEVSLSLHAVLQMLSNETFITFRVRASASSLMDSALASIA